MSSGPRLKLLLAPGCETDIETSSTVANRLAGLEYQFLRLDKPKGNLRILEFSWNNSCDVELWDICGAHSYVEGLPPICFMDAAGMVIVAGDVPKTLIEANNGFFCSSDFPIIWFVNESSYR